MPELESKNHSERLELTRRLHDGPAQWLIALGYQIDTLIADQDLGVKHRSALRNIRLDLIEITSAFRDEIYLLREITLIQAQKEIEALLPSKSLSISLPRLELKPNVERILALTLIEIARNSAKHSKCSRFWISSRIVENQLEVVVGDDGIWRTSTRDKSLGLRLIQEQIESIEGSIEMESGSEGTEFRIRFPNR